jgi:hypothetical protein
MLPLGDSWGGICRAQPGVPWTPGEDVLRPLCNLGYARGECPRFPGDGAPDAVRFTIARRDSEGLHLYYVVERDHHPYAHGPLDFAPERGVAGSAPVEDFVLRQAAAYIRSYLRRKTEPEPRFAASK